MLVNLFLFNFYTFDLKLKKAKTNYVIILYFTLSRSILSLIIVIKR